MNEHRREHHMLLLPVDLTAVKIFYNIFFQLQFSRRAIMKYEFLFYM